MKRLAILLATLAAVALVIVLAGCSSDDNESTTGPDSGAAPRIVTTYPADGATNVSRSTAVSLTFNTPMDTSSVRLGFHLAGGNQMHLWLDSLDHHYGMGGMGMMNMDHMMDWMDSIEYGGQFHWNAAFDSCQFIPDSTFMPDTDYLMFMYGNVQGRNGMMMDMDQAFADSLMFHFHTGPDVP